MAEQGFKFSLEWLLRNATAVAKGRALFSFLSDVSATDFKLRATIGQPCRHIPGCRVRSPRARSRPGSHGPIRDTRHHPTPQLNGGGFTDSAHRDKVLYWYVHSALWGRFSGSTETVRQRIMTPLRAGDRCAIATLERLRGGHLTIGPNDLADPPGAPASTRFWICSLESTAPETSAVGWSCVPNCSES